MSDRDMNVGEQNVEEHAADRVAATSPSAETSTAASESAAQGAASSGSNRQRAWLMLVLGVLLLLLVWALYSQLTSDGKRSAERSGNRSAYPGPAIQHFELDNAILPTMGIQPGGPPKDGIPALADPVFLDAPSASYLRGEDRVIGVSAGQDARAYPLRIMTYHEIVNDRIGQTPIAVTFCPLCDSAAVFDRRTKLGECEFGVSGLLYNSNVLIFDRGGAPDSLWSQIMAQGVSGPGANVPLSALPVELTTWDDWRNRHPETKVLSLETGFPAVYDRDPYPGYLDQPNLIFPASPSSDRLPIKAKVLGVWTDGTSRAYPTSAFSESRRRVEEQLDGRKVVVEFNPQADSLRVSEADDGVHWMYSLWFAWYAFRPETSVFEPTDGA